MNYSEYHYTNKIIKIKIMWKMNNKANIYYLILLISLIFQFKILNHLNQGKNHILII